MERLHRLKALRDAVGMDAVLGDPSWTDRPTGGQARQGGLIPDEPPDVGRFQVMSTPVPDRLERRAARTRLRVRGRNPATLALRVARRCSEIRVTGLAAEICYYLVLSILPLVTALGAGLAFVGNVLDAEDVAQMEAVLIRVVEAVLSPRLTEEIAVPLLQELLRSQPVGAAAGSVALALFLGSRVFRAAVRALGDAYGVTDRRGIVQLWGLSLVFTAAAVLVLTLLLSLLVVGPLLGGGQRLAEVVGAGDVFDQAWSLGRWPVVLLVCVGFLAWLYKVGQNARTRWRDALPGALLATVGVVVLLVGFRVFVEVVGPWGPAIEAGPDAVRLVGGFIGTALAAMLLGWLISMVVLLGGVVNAEWHASGADGERS